MKSKRKKDRYVLPPESFLLPFQTAVIFGVNRSGKTILGNLIASGENVEHADEPWLPYILPIMAKLGLVDEVVGRDLFRTYLSELMNEMVLLRRANFRPNDLSNIRNQKSEQDISFRLHSLNSRSDVKNFLQTKKPLLLLNLSESGSYALSSLSVWLPQAKFIQVVRQGEKVAAQIEQKGWFSDQQLAQPLNALIYKMEKYKNKNYYLPWWIKSGEEKKFLKFSDYKRGLFYRQQMLDYPKTAVKKLRVEKRYLEVSFEDLITAPQRIMKLVFTFLKVKPTPFSRQALKKFQTHEIK